MVQLAPPCDKTGACPGCGGALRPLGEDVTEILDHVPGSIRVVRHVRPKVSRRVCETIAQAPAPSLPIPARPRRCQSARARAGGHCDHLPQHRQAEIYAREDVALSRSTLADMVGQTVHRD